MHGLCPTRERRGRTTRPANHYPAPAYYQRSAAGNYLPERIHHGRVRRRARRQRAGSLRAAELRPLSRTAWWRTVVFVSALAILTQAIALWRAPAMWSASSLKRRSASASP
jgi:hypothetical protein